MNIKLIKTYILTNTNYDTYIYQYTYQDTYMPDIKVALYTLGDTPEELYNAYGLQIKFIIALNKVILIKDSHKHLL